MGNSMREFHVTKILFFIVSSWFINILLSTSCALKKREKFIYRLPIHVVTFSQSGRYLFIYVLCTCVSTIPHSIKPYFD